MKSEYKNYILFCVAILLIVLFRETSGKSGLTAAGIIFLIYFFLFKKDVALAFALCMVVNSNPLLILHDWVFGIPKYVSFRTIFFLLSFLVVFSPQVKERRVDYNLYRFLPILIAFTLFQFLVSFLLKVAPDNLKEILRLIYRQNPMYLGVYLIIPSYIISKIDGKKLIIAIALASTIFTLAIIINNYTPIQIFLLRTEYRNGTMRTFLFQSHTFYLPTYVAIAAFTFFGAKKAHIPIYMGGVAAMIVPMIAMYRLEMFTMFLTLLLVVFIVSKYLNGSLVGFFRLIKVLVLIFAMVLVLAPRFYRAMSDLYVQTFEELLGTGPVERGTTQTRTEHELPLHLGLIHDNPILGVGWRREWWDNFLNWDDWGLTDVPLTSTLAMYGFLGMLIYYSRFLYLLPLSKHVLKDTRKNREKIEKNGFHYIVIIALRAYFIAMISLRLFYIGYELTYPQVYCDFGAFLGIYFALIHKVERQNQKQ